MRREAMVVGLVLALAGCAGGTPKADVAPRDQLSRAGELNLGMAQRYLRKGDPETAIERAQQALRTDPQSAEVYAMLGMIHQSIDQQDRAGTFYERAARLAPNEGNILNIYAAWLCGQGKADEADGLFKRALADPFYKSRGQAAYNAGRCALQAGRPERAEAHLRNALELTPEDPLALEALAELKLAQGDALGARAFLQRREAASAATAEVLALGVRVERAAGDERAAARYQARLDNEFPKHAVPTNPPEASQP